MTPEFWHRLQKEQEDREKRLAEEVVGDARISDSDNSAAPWKSEWEKTSETKSGGQGNATIVQHKSDASKRGILKELLQRWQGNEKAIDRLKQEVKILLKLNTLNASVPEVYDSFLNHSDADPFILMEYIEGDRFDNWVKVYAPH